MNSEKRLQGINVRQASMDSNLTISKKIIKIIETSGITMMSRIRN
jgi:hypothetical protein